MTEAYAIKDKDDFIDARYIRKWERECWKAMVGNHEEREFQKRITHLKQHLFSCVPVTVSEKPQSHCERCKNLIQQCTCHPSKPTVSEKGEAEDIAVIRSARAWIGGRTREFANPNFTDRYGHAESGKVLCDLLDAYLSRRQVCEHGQGLTDYCQPCGRVNGGG